MVDDIISYLNKIAVDNNIRVIWEHFDPYTPPGSSYDDMCVVMNLDWHNKDELVFQYAHELSHIIRGDKTDLFFYNTLYNNKTGIEYETNLVAVRLLVPFYCSDTEIRDISVYDFLNSYCIPHYLADVAKNEITKFFNRNFKSVNNGEYILYWKLHYYDELLLDTKRKELKHYD